MKPLDMVVNEYPLFNQVINNMSADLSVSEFYVNKYHIDFEKGKVLFIRTLNHYEPFSAIEKYKLKFFNVKSELKIVDLL